MGGLKVRRGVDGDDRRITRKQRLPTVTSGGETYCAMRRLLKLTTNLRRRARAPR